CSRVLDRMADLASGAAFSAADLCFLLGRERRSIDLQRARQYLATTSVLVTGAGGSVGSGLVQRLAEIPSARLVAVDQHEASLFRLSKLPGLPALGDRAVFRLAD